MRRSSPTSPAGCRTALFRYAVAASVILLPGSINLAQQKTSAEQLEIPENFSTVQHIIRPGDTFISITKEFLGSTRFWPLNSQLNPGQEERKLAPGDRMTVLIDPERVPLTARIAKRSGTVEAQPNPLSWVGAQTNDLLIEKDAARTRRNSSAELAFPDGTSVVITEESLVFLRRLGRGLSTVASNRTTQQVELVVGQADLSSLAGSNATRADVEILMGGAKLRLPKESPIRTRTAIGEQGKSKIGMYEGDAQFESSGGGTLDIETGEGLVAVANEPPKKERLLAAPGLNSPPVGAQLVAGQLPAASWSSPGAGAVAYTFEVCRDTQCGDLIQRTTGLTSTTQAFPALTAGFYYWRATAASSSGLDGYPSDARMFEVIDLPPDNEPPQVALRMLSFGAPYDGLQAYGPSPPIGASVSDEGTGVERSGLLVNGRELGMDQPLTTGRTRIAVFAVDRARQRSVTEAIDLFIDADPPTLTINEREAPTVRRRTTKRPKRKRALLRAKRKGATYAANSVFALAKSEPVGFSLDDIEWRPLVALGTGLLTNSTTLQLAINDGTCLRAAGSQQRTAADGACGLSYLTINAADSHTGVKVLRARLEDGSLVVEAIDEVGNTTELRYRVITE